MDDLIKCLKCGNTLVKGKNAIMFFGKGTSIKCKYCGNKYVFGGEDGSKDKATKFIV